jgi:hypothetical protein
MAIRKMVRYYSIYDCFSEGIATMYTQIGVTLLCIGLHCIAWLYCTHTPECVLVLSPSSKVGRRAIRYRSLLLPVPGPE